MRSKTNSAPPASWPRPCAHGLRHYVTMLIAAVLQGRQAKQLQREREREKADFNGQAHVGRVRNATFAYSLILCPNIFTCNLFAEYISSHLRLRGNIFFILST